MSHPPCDRLVVAFELEIRPRPKARARHGKGRTYSDPVTVAYENAIGIACRKAMREQGAGIATGDVELLCLFEQRDGRRSDGDNKFKAIADALNGVCYVDDRQVIQGRFRSVLHADVDRVSVAVLAVTA